MANKIKMWFLNYFKRKKPLTIFFDILFIILLVLMLIPSTRKELSAFLIRTTSLPPSSLDKQDQYVINNQTRAWTLYDYNGKVYKFDDFNNKPVFLNMWATWCPPCVAELPAIVDLYQENNETANFILVSYENPEVVKAFAEKNGYSELPFYYASSTPFDFESQSIPTTFIISKEGRVMLKKKGAARWNSDRTVRLLKQLNEE
jgi:thiol-disulfide isomerase/thioredoxin